MLTGFAENNHGKTNYLAVDHDTKNEEIEAKLLELIDRKDIGIILISKNIAERVRKIIVDHTEAIPTILEIPAKDHPYEQAKDTIIERAAILLWVNLQASNIWTRLKMRTKKGLMLDDLTSIFVRTV